jgi:hypothetical protein
MPRKRKSGFTDEEAKLIDAAIADPANRKGGGHVD